MGPNARAVSGAVAGAAILLGATGASVPRTASACSLAAEVSHEWLAAAVAQADAVVVGTFDNASEDVVGLRVEESVKGSTAEGETLAVYNRETDVTPGCELTVTPGWPGHRFEEGTRVVAMLVPDTFGTAADWVPITYGVYVLDGEAIEADQPYAAKFTPGGLTLRDVRLATGRAPVPSRPSVPEESGWASGTGARLAMAAGLVVVGVAILGVGWLARRW